MPTKPRLQPAAAKRPERKPKPKAAPEVITQRDLWLTLEIYNLARKVMSDLCCQLQNGVKVELGPLSIAKDTAEGKVESFEAFGLALWQAAKGRNLRLEVK